MRNGMAAPVVLALVLLPLLSACDTLAPETLGTFSWTEIEGGPVDEFANYAAVGTDVLVIGELNTPSACFSLSPDLTETRTRLTLRIEARDRQTPNCAQRTGSYRYEAQLNGLDNGTYDFIIVHDVDGNRSEFEHVLVIN